MANESAWHFYMMEMHFGFEYAPRAWNKTIDGILKETHLTFERYVNQFWKLVKMRDDR